MLHYRSMLNRFLEFKIGGNSFNNIILNNMPSDSPKQYTTPSQPSNWSLQDNVIHGVLPLSIAIISFVCTFIYNKRSTPIHTSSHKSNGVPFIAFQEPDWTVLHKCTEAYRAHNLRLLQTLSQGLDILYNSKELNNTDKIADRLQDRIERLSEIFDLDQDVLQRQLFVPFQTIYVLPDGVACEQTKLLLQPSETRRVRADHSYDDPHQVVAHIVRDWTVEGRNIRRQLYDWCLSKIDSPGRRILVPGAGMGRLAWELARQKHAWVEAVESSVEMAAAAASILQRKQSGFLHPYSSDQLTNEVNSSQRYLRVKYPDVEDVDVPHGHMSYTIADFLSLKHVISNQSLFDAVITCFFLDTASNVIEYIATVANLLKSNGGIWINVGPLQWHQKSRLRLSADELYDLIQAAGFKILEWSVDIAPIEYRSSDNLVRSTHYDAYCPLRFVASVH